MSILIKGIDMPNKIDLDFHDNHIVLGGVLYPIDIDQLVYIPTPHGDLIDGDSFIKDFIQNFEECRNVGYFSTEEYARIAEIVASGVTSDINNAPTILDEEGK